MPDFALPDSVPATLEVGAGTAGPITLPTAGLGAVASIGLPAEARAAVLHNVFRQFAAAPDVQFVGIGGAALDPMAPRLAARVDPAESMLVAHRLLGQVADELFRRNGSGDAAPLVVLLVDDAGTLLDGYRAAANQAGTLARIGGSKGVASVWVTSADRLPECLADAAAGHHGPDIAGLPTPEDTAALAEATAGLTRPVRGVTLGTGARHSW